MTLKKEITAFDFLVDESWDTGDLSDRIQDACKVDEFNQLADGRFPDGATEEELNDWLRFHGDDILSDLGVEDEG